MPNARLPQLAGDWTTLVSNWIMPLTGAGPTVAANNGRLALGFSYSGTNLVRLIVKTPSPFDFSFYLQGPGEKWFWWQKYSVLVGLAWDFNNIVGGLDSVRTMEIIQTQQGQ